MPRDVRPVGDRFGLAIPQLWIGEPLDRDLVRDVVRRAEQRGFGSLWTVDTILSRHPFLEAVGLLSYVAAITERPRLGISVLVAPLRNPVQLAKNLADVDVLSGGRLTVGLGVGGRGPRPGVESGNEYAVFGLEDKARVARFVEGLQVMKALWTEEAATLAGRFWQLDGVGMQPKPIQKPHPPVWFGASHPDALRRAARLADGWMGGGSSSTADFRVHVAKLREELEAAGRDPDAFPISKRLYLVIDDDADRARRHAREFTAALYGSPDFADAFDALGPAPRIAEEIEAVRDAGADMIVLHPLHAPLEHVDALADLVTALP